MRISGFSSLFSAIAVFLSTFVGGYENTAIAEKRAENPEILTDLVRKRLTRFRGFEKGLAGRAPKIQQKLSPRIVFSYSQRWHRKKGAKKGLSLWSGRDFLAPVPSVRHPVETSDPSLLLDQTHLPQIGE